MTITILTHDDRWKGLAPTVKRAAEAVLSELSFPRRRESSAPRLRREKALMALDSRLRGNDKISITIILTNDAEVKTLNRDFRGKNKPTNVLSFPDGSDDFSATGTPIKNLGDIVLAYETIAREAVEQGKSLKHHLTHLTIHGVLHLLGYDHETEQDANAMESLEISLLATMGIANPYETA